MMTFTVWIGFFFACLVFSISPGPGAIASMSCALSHGLRRTFWLVSGLQLALLAHLIIVAVGLGALIESSAFAYATLKYLGAAYLIYLGIARWREEVQPVALTADNSQAGAGTLVLRGILINLLNPKSILFLAAFLPQFLDPAMLLAPQYMVLGATTIFVDTLVMAGYTLTAKGIGEAFGGTRRARIEQRTFALLFVGLGVVLAGA